MSYLNRTYSNPNLKATSNLYGGRSQEWETQREKLNVFGHEDFEDDTFYVIGDRVYVDGFRPASVAYFGEVEFSSGDWVGVVLDSPTGNHDGKLHGRKYFQCAPLHGLFVRPYRVNRIPDSALGSSRSSSRVSTPMPTKNSLLNHQDQSEKNCRSPGANSIAESYYYDEDYRSQKPTVDSLMQRLRSIRNQCVQTAPPRSSILKREPRSKSTEPTLSNDYSLRNWNNNEESERRRPASRVDRSGYSVSQSPSRDPVFNFRPRRERLDGFENRLASNNQERPVSRSGANRTVGIIAEPPVIGDRVFVRTERGETTGILRFMGETEFATGEWAGVELSEPEGKHDGSILGQRYFYCPENHGLFVPAVRIRKYQPSSDFNTMRYTITSPPPTEYKYSNRGSYTSGSRSTTPSHGRDSSSSFNSKTDYGIDRFSPLKSNKSSLDTTLSYHHTTPACEAYRGGIKSKFDDKDIERQLRKSIQKHSSNITPKTVTDFNIEPIKPKSVKYTFLSSKYDGNPIVRRTVQYD